MRKIYVITGESGEWDDQVSWLVAAHADEAAARYHCDKIQEQIAERNATVTDENYDDGKRWYDPADPDDVCGPILDPPPYDLTCQPQGAYDRKTATYTVTELDLIEPDPDDEEE